MRPDQLLAVLKANAGAGWLSIMEDLPGPFKGMTACVVYFALIDAYKGLSPQAKADLDAGRWSEEEEAKQFAEYLRAALVLLPILADGGAVRPDETSTR
jgi:hypothetical protein